MWLARALTAISKVKTFQNASFVTEKLFGLDASDWENRSPENARALVFSGRRALDTGARRFPGVFGASRKLPRGFQKLSKSSPEASKSSQMRYRSFPAASQKLPRRFPEASRRPRRFPKASQQPRRVPRCFTEASRQLSRSFPDASQKLPEAPRSFPTASQQQLGDSRSFPGASQKLSEATLLKYGATRLPARFRRAAPFWCRDSFAVAAFLSAAGGCWGFVGDGTLEGLDACREGFLLLGVVIWLLEALGALLGMVPLEGWKLVGNVFFSWTLLSGTPKACTQKRDKETNKRSNKQTNEHNRTHKEATERNNDQREGQNTKGEAARKEEEPRGRRKITYD